MPVKKKPLVDYPDNPDEIPYEQRLTMAWEAYIDSNGKLSIRKAAAQHGIQWERLRDRINGAKPRNKEAETRQRLGHKKRRLLRGIYYNSRFGDGPRWLASFRRWQRSF